jgi:DNA-binding transcriptional MerR regulator
MIITGGGTMTIKECADTAGISIRTLHYYDEIGLLTPEKNQSGYRVYTEKDLDLLQQILFYRTLGFSLSDIKSMIYSKNFDIETALAEQRSALIEKQDQLNTLIETIDQTILYHKGEIEMKQEAKFKGFDFTDNPYEKEARKRYGNDAVDNTIKNIKGKEDIFSEEANKIYEELASLRNDPPYSQAAQAAIEKWYRFLNRLGNYSLDTFEGLGQMYVYDERFKAFIDKFGKGLAQFMCDAMAIYARNHR